MRRKRTRSSPSNLSTASCPASISSSDSDNSETSSSTCSGSSDEEQPLQTIKSPHNGKDKAANVKPPRKKLKTMNLNGSTSSAATSTSKSLRNKRRNSTTIEKSTVERVKQRHKEAAAAKVARQSSSSKAVENLNPASKPPTNGKAKENSSSKLSMASSSVPKSLGVVSRRNSTASTDVSTSQPAKSRPRNGNNGKSEKGAKKTDPEAIHRRFLPPSQIYQVLAQRKYERPYILQRNLSYMTPKNRVKKNAPKEEKFKLPAILASNPLVVNDQATGFLLGSGGFKSPPGSRRNSFGKTCSPKKSPKLLKQIDAKNRQLNIVLCQVVGPTICTGVRSRRSLTTNFSKKNMPPLLLDVIVCRNYVSKQSQSKTENAPTHSNIKIDFTQSDGKYDEKFFEGDYSKLFTDGPNGPQSVCIDGADLYPPNGYTEGKSIVRLRATVEGSGLSYEISLEATRNLDNVISNGFYSANLKTARSQDDLSNNSKNSPRLLFAAFWSTTSMESIDVFAQLRQHKLKAENAKKKMQPVAFPPQNLTNSAQQNKISSNVTTKSRILHVSYWLTDPSAGGSGVCASVPNPMSCPWCQTVCPHFLSLLRHLRCWHPRLSFVLQAERLARVADIVVSINKRYNHSEEYQHPPTLLADVPLVGITEPVKRFPNSQIVWVAPKGKQRRNFNKASSTALAEFRRQESEMNPSSSAVVAGHMRTYYHSQTCMPMSLEYLNGDCDSDCEEQPWLNEHAWRMLNEFTDVNAGEKSMMNIWNSFLCSERYFAQRAMFPACLAFVDERGAEVAAKGLLGNFRLHLTCLHQNKLLTAQQFFAVMVRLERCLDSRSDWKQSPVKTPKLGSPITNGIIKKSPSVTTVVPNNGCSPRKSISNVR